MKTWNKQLQILVVVMFGFIATPVRASLSYSTSFNVNQLDTTTQVVDGVSYLHLEYADLYTSGEVGAPELPVCYLRFSVPYNATNFTVSARSLRSAILTYSTPIYPVQPPIPTNADLEAIEFVAPDSTIYHSSQYYPASLAEVVEEGFLGGDNHIVTVALYPISYSPVAGNIKLHTNLTVTLNYTIGDNSSGMRPLLSYKSTLARQRDFDNVGQLVVNPTQVEEFAPTIDFIAQSPVPSTGLPVYQYCVVTSRALAPAFDRLIAWKRQKGYTAGVVCIEDILEHPDFQAGDTVSNINDDAGKLRAYLQYAYRPVKKTEYLLLAGDYSVLPIRYGDAGNNAPSVVVSTDNKIPSDLYFSDLTGSWNKDGDSHYGETTGDDIDYYPEIYVGRLLCTQAQEIANYTEKLFRYEQNPGNGDFGYLKKAFYCQSDEMQRDNEASIIKSAWGDVFSQDTIIQEIPSYDTQEPISAKGADVINEMNNRYGFFSWHGHGVPAGILVRNKGCKGSWKNYAIVPFDGVLDLDENSLHYDMEVEIGHGLDNLTNEDYPSIAYSMSCIVTPFDIYGGFNIPYNIGSAFTVAGLYGGPAFLGNTRYGWISISVLLEREFVKQIKSGRYQIGIAEAKSKELFYDDWCRLTHNLIGCPEFEMWTDIPTRYTDIAVQRTDNGITVSSSDLADSKVAVTSGVDRLPEINLASGTSLTLNSVSPNSVVTIYKHNAIPYMAPLYWQNDTLSDSQYLLVNDVTMGKAVDANRTAGEIVLNNGTTTLDASGTIQVDEGTVVEGNAHLIFKNNSSAMINGCVIQNGGKLTIEGDGEVMISGCTIRDGGTLALEGMGEILIVGGVVEPGGTFISNSAIEFVGDFEFQEGSNVELN